MVYREKYDTGRRLQVRVTCDAAKREMSPQRFFIGARKVEVNEVVDRWLEIDYGYFKVQADDGGTYILKHNALADDWEITLYDSGAYHDFQPISGTVKAYT